MAKFGRTYLCASLIGAGVFVAGNMALCSYAQAWVPGGGYDAQSIEHAARQDRADHARQMLRNYPEATNHCCESMLGSHPFPGSKEGQAAGGRAGEGDGFGGGK